MLKGGFKRRRSTSPKIVARSKCPVKKEKAYSITGRGGEETAN
ncbi:hypothetical protein SLEP1_g24149 [Rubroshorea leprosula]|uniref:Uncharacterized protein n=1 Tax=Rubroshorea leprosula TaxID=152421 RepID=A0AAV5JND7_9ROSI|nr:hypothetical protein SLEP1_g24149 [Rubroshorea leprosula]